MQVSNDYLDYYYACQANSGTQPSGPVSNDPVFQQYSNALWQALTEYNSNKNPMTLQAVIDARQALSNYFSKNVPASTDEPAYDVYNDLELGTGNLLNDLGNVNSCYKDQSNATFKGYVDQLLGDIKEYDWEMSLPPGQQDPAVIQALLKGIATAINNIANTKGITDGYLTVLLNELNTPTSSGGSSLASLAESAISSGDFSAFQKALSSIGETGSNGGELRYITQQAAWEEYGDQ